MVSCFRDAAPAREGAQLTPDPRVEDSPDIKTTEKDIRASVESSVKRMGGPPDLWLIHTPYIPEQGKIGEFWTIMEGLVEDGTLKGTSLGVSNFRPQDLQEVLKVAKIKPVVNRESGLLPSLALSLRQNSNSTHTSSRSSTICSRCSNSTASSRSLMER